MNKTELAAKVAEKTGATKKASEEAVSAVVAAVVEALAAGEKVQIAGLGGFEVKEVAAHKGVNPQTGAEIEIAASKKVSFKASKSVKDAVNA